MDKKDEEKTKDKNKDKKKHHHHHHHDKEKEREKDGKVRSINLSDYEMGETLGTGSFGRVKIAKNKKTGEFVAIKINFIT